MKRIGLSNLRLHILPVFVWLVAVAGVAALFQRRTQRFEILGMAQGQVRQIAATCTGRLKSVPVQLFQEVREGDPVAIIDTVLDNEQLEAELTTASAEIQCLRAELVHTQERLLAEASNQQTNWIADKRRFSVDVENVRLRILDLKTQFETDRTMLENLELNSKIFIAQNISDQNDVTYYELQKTKVEYSALAKKIEANQHLLAQAESDLKQSRQRRDGFTRRQPQHPPVDTALEVIRKAIRVQELMVEQLLARREPLVLKSPIDGVVIQLHGRARDVVLRRPGEFVFRRPGEVVLAGDSILSVAGGKPTEIIAYASREQLGLIREGMVVELVKNTRPAQIARSQVAYLAPTLERIPEWLWQTPNIPQWGHPIRIEIPPGMKLFSGEMVGIREL